MGKGEPVKVVGAFAPGGEDHETRTVEKGVGE